MRLTLVEQIHDGVRQLGLVLSRDAEEKFGEYLRLLAKWNRTYNLTAVRDEYSMVSQHLLDSLAVLACLDTSARGSSSLADVGSGGGLPGIPLAIAQPEMQVELFEASHKKATFLEQARIELNLDNVSIHCGRIERFKPMHLFDVVISRAFSSLADFVQLAGHLLAPEGRLLAMKGIHPEEEIEHLPTGWRVLQSIPLTIPGLNARREIIVIEQV